MTEQIDLVRKRDTGEPGNGGQFGTQAKGASELSLHGTGPRAGTAIFPPPFGGWAAEDYIEWWENVPLDDDGVLMNVQREYKLKWEERRSAYAGHKHDQWRQANPDPGHKGTFRQADAWEAADRAAWDQYNDEFEAQYPDYLPDTRVRGVYRAFKMWEYSAQLDESARAKVLNHQLRIGGEDLTVQQTHDRYRLDFIGEGTRKSINETLFERLADVLGTQTQG